MLVDISILLLCFGLSGSEDILEPVPFVKNLKQLQSSNDPPRPVPELPDNFPLPSYSQSSAGCQRRVAQCSGRGEAATCYGTRLPHSSLGPPLTNTSREEDWAGLALVPACWAALQPLLCAVFHPKCDPASSHTHLVPRLLCRAAVRPCQIVTETLPELPEFLDCANDEIFSDDCDQDSRSERAKFNASTACVAPLTLTSTRSAFWPGVEECGLRCQSPVLSSTEYDSVHSFIAAGATVSLLASLFAVFTFFVDWKGGSRYPARAIFYLNACFVVANTGWLAQFAGDSVRKDIVCRGDGVGRHQEPGQGENLSCVAVFILVYFFSQAAAVWTVVVSYSWYVTFTWASQPNKVQEILTKRAPYFHMAAWSLPLVLTIIILASNKVDGSYVSGICFVGYHSPVDQLLLVYLPLSCALAVAGYFTVKSVALLLDILREVGKGVLPGEAGAKVRRTVTRILVFSVLVLGSLVTAASCHLYTLARHGSWERALDQLVRCNIGQQLGTAGGGAACSMEARPSLALLQLQLLAMFGAGVLGSSWVWTRTSLTSWLLAAKHLLRRGDRPVKLHKHELIAQAFAKRAELQANGRLSLTFHSCHEDPLAMGLSVDPDTSGDFSSGWAAALPHLVTRRPGLCGADQLGLGRRASLDSVSNVSRSISIRSGRFSWFGSRKGSEDSNMSIQQSDLDRLQSIYDEAIKPGKKRSKREFFKSHKSRMRPWSRSTSRSRRHSVTSRGSDNSSVFSQFSQVLPAITLDPKRLKSKVTMSRNKFSLPSPGRSIDFGRDRAGDQFSAGDPTFMELEEKLRQLASISRTSNVTDKDGEVKISIDLARPNTCSIETQTEILEDEVSTRLNMISTGTQMTPPAYHRPVRVTTETSTEPDSISPPPSLPPLVSPASTTASTASPLQHIEANVVNIKVLGPSSEDSSIPSSYEKDFKMKRISTTRGKENFQLVPSQDSAEAESLSITVGEINIPALKKLGEAGGGASGGMMRPRDHNRGRRGAIVTKLSPGAQVNTSAENTDS